VSWKRALETIDARLKLYPDAEDGSLRRRRNVIGKTYADFEANFPGLGPNSFASLVMAMGSRSGDSGFPNLLVAKERERYGI
jgi:hypothetical protein